MFVPIIAFLTSTIGKYLLIGAVVVATFVGIRQSGYNAAMRKCEAAALQLKLQAKQADLDAANKANAEMAKARDESAARAEQSEQEVARYAEELKKRPNGACLLTDDDIIGGLPNTNRKRPR